MPVIYYFIKSMFTKPPLTLTLPGPSAGVSGSFDSYCSLKPLCSGMGEVVPARTSPTLLPHPLALCCHYPVSKCCSASIVVTSTVRVKKWFGLISNLPYALNRMLKNTIHLSTTAQNMGYIRYVLDIVSFYMCMD